MNSRLFEEMLRTIREENGSASGDRSNGKGPPKDSSLPALPTKQRAWSTRMSVPAVKPAKNGWGAKKAADLLQREYGQIAGITGKHGYAIEAVELVHAYSTFMAHRTQEDMMEIFLSHDRDEEGHKRMAAFISVALHSAQSKYMAIVENHFTRIMEEL